MAQKGRGESQEAALEGVSRRSKVGKETNFGKTKNARQWVGCGGSTEKCGSKKLNDKTHLRRNKIPKEKQFF